MADDLLANQPNQGKDRISIPAQRLDQIGFALTFETGKMQPPHGRVVRLIFVADFHA